MSRYVIINVAMVMLFFGLCDSKSEQPSVYIITNG